MVPIACSYLSLREGRGARAPYGGRGMPPPHAGGAARSAWSLLLRAPPGGRNPRRKARVLRVSMGAWHGAFRGVDFNLKGGHDSISLYTGNLGPK